MGDAVCIRNDVKLIEMSGLKHTISFAEDLPVSRPDGQEKEPD